MVVVFFPISDDVPTLEPAALEAFARLGITSASLLRDSDMAALVLEGWAFDASQGLDAARAAVGDRDEVRTLQPLVQMAVSAASIEGGTACASGS